MIYGLDTLLLPHYGSVAIHNWPDGFYCGSFAIEGGDAYPWLDKLLATGKCPGVRIQLLWHGTHLYSENDIPNITHLSQRYEQLALKYPDKKIYLSPFCEAQNIATPDRYLDVVAHNAPHCTPVWSPVNGVWSHKYINETHGGGVVPPGPGLYFRSGDGGVNNHDDTDCDITHEKQKHSTCEVFFVWRWCFNGNYHAPHPDEPHIPIDKRTGWPTAKDFHAAAYLATERGNVHMDNHWLLKSNSELHGSHDQKGNKLMLISPQHTDKVVLKRSGKVIDILPRFIPNYTDGRARYYSEHMGYEVGADIQIWAEGKQHGFVNCGFRTGK